MEPAPARPEQAVENRAGATIEQLRQRNRQGNSNDARRAGIVHATPILAAGNRVFRFRTHPHFRYDDFEGLTKAANRRAA
jgi:hypothetical protein